MKVPIAEINKLIESTGWDVQRIYAAMQIQECELKVKKSETWNTMCRYHWDEPEYKELEQVYSEIERKMQNMGEE